ncbi:MAG: malto-oligosyltrehalose trehalohydrolase [Acidimicrobiales bacterium]
MASGPVRLWAPRAETVDVVVDGGRMATIRNERGWVTSVAAIEAGERYAFSLDDGEPMPDPRSHRQPDGVFGSSEVVDHDAFVWTDRAWHGMHLPAAVLYELHVGTFTAGGSFRSAIERLPELVELGVTAIELMPVAAFDGERGWGYDGVLLHAVHEPYGGPAGLKELVDAAHGLGLGVLLDVVWNHLGPTGNRLAELGPYFDDATQTPWGVAVNLDGPGCDEVRRFLLDSAALWLGDYHLDGLRLDAVHALVDTSPTHLLSQLEREVRIQSAHVGRPLWLIAESDANDPRLTGVREAGGYGLHAQWADDLHHAIHVAVTGERQGYYADYCGAPDVVAAYERGFVFDGRWSEARQRRVGASTVGMGRDRFVTCTQNHDQVGNRARGDRLAQVAGPDAARVAAALLLVAPGVPMLFMGEEWAASTPFPYFVGARNDELDDAVRRGRIAEFAAFGWDPDDIPDPVDEATMHAAVLRWEERAGPEHAAVIAWYRALIELRRQEPDLTDPTPGVARGAASPSALWVRRGAIELVANVGAETAVIDVVGAERSLLLTNSDCTLVSDTAVTLAPMSVAIFRCAPAPG